MAVDKFDYSRLKTILVNSKIGTSNNALFQTINQLIGAAKSFSEQVGQEFASIGQALKEGLERLKLVEEFAEALDDVRINLIEVDTSAGPVGLNLDDIVDAFTIIKDITGTADVNNITLTGTVDNVVDPVISSAWGFVKVYRHEDGTFYFWDSPTTGSGSGSSYADHLDTVVAERATYVGGGGTFATDLSILDIPVAVATALFGVDGAGLLEKTTGAQIAPYGATYVSVSRICYPDGTVFKILTDAGPGGANGAAWNYDGQVSASKYVPV